MRDPSDQLQCSFCGKSQRQVRKLIAGPGVYICDECIELCNEIIDEEFSNPEVLTDDDLPKPREINRILNEYVIGQEDAKKVLAVAVYNHYKRIQMGPEPTDGTELQKSNILLIGPTGSGKTLLAQTLAKILNVPFAIADATALTEAGYVGEDVENILLKLIQAADFDVKKAETGIIYIDEIDKIARKSDNPFDHPRRLRRGRTAGAAQDTGGYSSQRTATGRTEAPAPGLPADRHQERALYLRRSLRRDSRTLSGSASASGASASVVISADREEEDPGTIFMNTQPEDLLGFGLIPEFVGRLPVISTLRTLEEKDLIRILTEPKNALVRQYRQFFRYDKVDLAFTEAALTAVAEQALERGTGARGSAEYPGGVALADDVRVAEPVGHREVHRGRGYGQRGCAAGTRDGFRQLQVLLRRRRNSLASPRPN